MAFEPAVLEGGYVTDLLLTIAFDGEAWEEAHIGELGENIHPCARFDGTINSIIAPPFLPSFLPAWSLGL